MGSSAYQARQFNLSNLKGISDATLEMHFKLYEGYVKETNRLNEITAGIIQRGNASDEQKAAFSEIKPRLGFEYNGMILHEYYFENLMKDGTGEPAKGSGLIKAAEASFGSYET